MTGSRTDVLRRIHRYVLASQFGPLVASVFAALESKGPCILQTLCSHTRIAPRLVREALLVLLQHRLVRWRRPAEGDERAAVFYEADAERAILCLCLPTLAVHVENRLGRDHCKHFVSVILSGHARYTPEHHDELVKLGVICFISSNAAGPGDEPEGKRARVDRWVGIEYGAVRQVYLVRFLQSSGIPLTDAQLHALLVQRSSFSPHHARIDHAVLLGLAQTLPWLSRCSAPSDSFGVDHVALCHCVCTEVTLSFLRSRLGAPSARLYAILVAKHYADERSLAKTAMITGKECRERLYALLRLGAVHLQEIPRTADHAPARTIFLWTTAKGSGKAFARSTHWLARFYEKTIANTAERSLFELDRHSLLLAKAGRADVRDRQSELLAEDELAQLHAVEAQQARMHVMFDRLMAEYVLLSS